MFRKGSLYSQCHPKSKDGKSHTIVSEQMQDFYSNILEVLLLFRCSKHVLMPKLKCAEY